MNYLAAFAAKVISLLTVPFFDWLNQKIDEGAAEAAAKKQIEADNKAVREKTEAAKTKGARDEAARDTINNL